MYPPRVIEIHIDANSIDQISNAWWSFENESDWNTIWYSNTPFVPIPVKINIGNSSYFGILVLTTTDYQPIIIKEADADEFRVIGEFIGVVKAQTS